MRLLSTNETIDKILDLMNKRGISKKDLSDMIGSGNNLYKVLSGDVRKISADTVSKIAQALDCDSDYLLFDTTEERKTVSSVADYLGLSESAVKYISGLNDTQLSGLNSVLNKRCGFGRLLQIFGEQKTDSHFKRISDTDSVTDYDIMQFSASRIVCSLLDWLRV